MKKIKIGDIIVIFAVVALTVGLFLFKGLNQKTGDTVIISVSGKESTYSLSENHIFNIGNNGISFTVVIKDGSVYIEKTECPNKTCMEMGKISHNGETICCVPAELYVKIVGERSVGYDEIIG